MTAAININCAPSPQTGVIGGNATNGVIRDESNGVLFDENNHPILDDTQVPASAAIDEQGQQLQDEDTNPILSE